MSKKRFFLRLISAVLCFVLISSNVFCSAAVFTFETQFDHDAANRAWLTDLIIKEDMTSLKGISTRVELVAAPDYPYTETAESFKKEVNYFTSLYRLNSGSAKSAYLMLFEELNAHSAVLSPSVSDGDVRAYLEGSGISYPDQVGEDELIIARTLYTAMASGALTGDIFSNGNGLEQVLVAFLINLTGIDEEELKAWTAGKSLLSLDEYILAAAKLTLWSGGYEVTPETPDEEVYRLSALMTVRETGVSVSSDATLDELKYSYIAAMLGKKYGVSVDPKKLEAAMADGSTAFYILQLIGKKSGLSLTSSNCTYERAFSLVAKHTHAFDIEAGEFYADIYNYDIYLSEKCSTLWLYPTSYSSTADITANGKTIRNNYFLPVKLDPERERQKLEIKVSLPFDKSECTYTVIVHQGKPADEPETEAPSEPDSGSPYPNSSTLISDVLASLGLDKLTADILNKQYISLPYELAGVLPVIAPTFNGFDTGDISFAPGFDDIRFSVLLDELNDGLNADIQGIYGINLDALPVSANDIAGYVTFG